MELTCGTIVNLAHVRSIPNTCKARELFDRVPVTWSNGDIMHVTQKDAAEIRNYLWLGSNCQSSSFQCTRKC